MQAVANYAPPPPTYINMALQIAPNYANHIRKFSE